MKVSNLVSFALGAVAMLGVSLVSTSQAQPPNHVFEYRKYYANPGKTHVKDGVLLVAKANKAHAFSLG